MTFLKDKLVYLASDGVTVNCGTKAGLAVKFREVGASWLVFVWWMSHRIELALKDSLEDAMQPIKKSLTALFYCYEKSSKKLRELLSCIRFYWNLMNSKMAEWSPLSAAKQSG